MRAPILCVLLLATPVLAQGGPAPLRDLTRAPIASSPALALPTDQVWIDEPGDGRVWARGADWKASFGADGFAFHPFLGADAPRTEVARFAPRALTAGALQVAFEREGAVRVEHRTVTIARGAFDEVYHLTPEGVEQTFVLRALPARGELVLSLALDSELPRHVGPDGALELAGPRGGVRYGAALALDAAGARRTLETRPSAEGLELRVPHDFVAAARLPLVIDPWITTISVPQTAGTVAFDLAYDAAFDRACLVIELPFSAADHDVFSMLLDGDGTPMWSLGVWADITTDSWLQPHVAANQATHNFMCVARVRPYGSWFTQAKGRVRSLSIPSQTPQRVYGATPAEQLDVRVGGASEGSPSRYLVGWTRFAGHPTYATDMQAQLVDHEGLAVGAPILVSDDGQGWDHLTAISSDQGGGPMSGRCWNLVGYRGVGEASGVYGAQVAPDGSVLEPPFPVAAPGIPSAVSAPQGESTWGRPWMLVTASASLNPGLPRAVAMASTTLIASAELGALVDASPNAWVSGVEVAADQFVIAWTEPSNAPGGGSRIQVTTLWAAGDGIGATEWPATLDDGSVIVGPVLASRGDAGGGCLVAFARAGQDVGLATYSAPPAVGPVPFCAGDGSAAPCPCGNEGGPGFGCANSAWGWGAYLQGYGQARVSDDQLGLWVSSAPAGALCLYMQGTTAETPLPFDDGLLCVRGDTRLIGTHVFSGDYDAYPGPGDPSISEAGLVPGWPCVRTYQVRYRDASPVCAGGGWNATGAVEVVWLP